MARIALLHPGEMGVTVGAAAAAGGAEVGWASAQRSAATAERAAGAGLVEYPTLPALLEGCEVVLSVCPPDRATDTASAVASAGFRGLYIDCNAVAPDTAREVARIIEGGGAQFVDGGIIGPPAHSRGSTRLYLSGPRAGEATELFADSKLAAIAMQGGPGAASALKMCYAGWTKCSSALLMNVRALAAAEGISDELLSEWDLSLPAVAKRSGSAAADNAFKAWRFVGEMHEIAATFASAGLPGDFHHGAAEIYQRLAGFKGRGRDVSPDEATAALLGTAASDAKSS